VVFAVDSIPAVFGVTRDPFIVFTSNIFAILGLRALYFVLKTMMDSFRFLKVGLGLVLVFVGGKMCLEKWFEVPAEWSLLVVVSLLGASVTASLVWPGTPVNTEEGNESAGEPVGDGDDKMNPRNSPDTNNSYRFSEVWRMNGRSGDVRWSMKAVGAALASVLLLPVGCATNPDGTTEYKRTAIGALGGAAVGAGAGALIAGADTAGRAPSSEAPSGRWRAAPSGTTWTGRPRK